MTRPPTEMELRVARAICSERGLDPDISFRSPYYPEWLDWVDEARAAIRAMREPTKEQIMAANGWSDAVTIEDVYKAMIDAASPPEKP